MILNRLNHLTLKLANLYIDSLFLCLRLFGVIINRTVHSPSIEHSIIGIRRGAMQDLIVFARSALSQLGRVRVDAPVLHDSRDLSARIQAFKVRTVKEPKEGRTRSFTSKPEPASIGTKVLMHLQRCGRGPVGVAAVGPGL